MDEKRRKKKSIFSFCSRIKKKNEEINQKTLHFFFLISFSALIRGKIYIRKCQEVIKASSTVITNSIHLWNHHFHVLRFMVQSEQPHFHITFQFFFISLTNASQRKIHHFPRGENLSMMDYGRFQTLVSNQAKTLTTWWNTELNIFLSITIFVFLLLNK